MVTKYPINNCTITLDCFDSEHDTSAWFDYDVKEIRRVFNKALKDSRFPVKINSVSVRDQNEDYT